MAAVIKSGGKYFICGVEVAEDFANWYDAVERRESLDERRETRRHQSIGEFCIPDNNNTDVFCGLERKQVFNELKFLLRHLTDKQRFVLFHYSIYEMSFREIGEKLGIHKESAREHYHASVKKLQKFLKKHPVKLPLSWLLGEGSKALSKKREVLFMEKNETAQKKKLTLDDVKEDLKEIKFYFSQKVHFDKDFNIVPNQSLLEKVRMYSEAVNGTTAFHHRLFILLYVENCTQKCVASELGLSLPYINGENKKLLQYLLNKLNKGGN